MVNWVELRGSEAKVEGFHIERVNQRDVPAIERRSTLEHTLLQTSRNWLVDSICRSADVYWLAYLSSVTQ